MSTPPEDSVETAHEGRGAPGPHDYRERLAVPWWWWLIGLALAASAVVAVGAFLGPSWALGSSLVSLAVVVAALLPWHLTAITADRDGLRAGGAHIGWGYLERAEPLDGAQARARLGPDADVRDWLLVRPYLGQAVEVRLNDPADPHPAWILSTRHPELLARVINDQIACVKNPSDQDRVDSLKDSPAEGDVR